MWQIGVTRKWVNESVNADGIICLIIGVFPLLVTFTLVNKTLQLRYYNLKVDLNENKNF